MQAQHFSKRGKGTRDGGKAAVLQREWQQRGCGGQQAQGACIEGMQAAPNTLPRAVLPANSTY
jgi:hypothetical protein